jgi:hypothetical protein
MREPAPDRRGKSKQRGAALMIMVAILVIGFAAILVGALSYSAMNSARQERTSAALARAKEALIGYAVSDANRPGELPCPDFDNDGMVTLADYTGSNCKSLIGRLPWITLGLPDLRDGSGEHLWYALTDEFHANSSAVLNSNTKGTLLVYDTDGTSLQTKAGYSAVAVIFAPGSPLSTQTRGTVAQQNSAANYLDTANGTNNAIGLTYATPRFIAGAKSDTFNDQLLFITTQDLTPLVEQRVASVVKKALDDYFAAYNFYPWADSIGTTAAYGSDIGLNQGWLPDDATTGGSDPTPNWVAGSPPAWFFANEWYSLIYYSVAKDKSVQKNICTSCTTSKLKVDADSGVLALFFMPGTPIGTRWYDKLDDYLEDSENNQHNAVPNASPPPPSVSASATPPDDIYITPTSQNRDRDRIYYFSGTSWKP